MDPIGSANKYLAIAIEEYGLDDYTIAIENEERLQEEFGFDFAAIAEGAGKLIAGGTKLAEEHGDKFEAGFKLFGQIQKATATTKKGRKKRTRGKKKMKSASSSKSMNKMQKKLEMMRGKVEKTTGELQMALGEMRRQLTMTGVSDPDLQLEVVRNAFAKQYFDMDSSKKLEKVLLKKTIKRMDDQLMQAFHRRNQQRASRGLKPLIASYQQPTIEYRV